MATIQTLSPLRWGFLPNSNSPSTVAYSLNAAAATNLYGFGFVSPDADRTVNSIRAYISAVTGTVAIGDITCAIYGDSGAGVPGSSLSSVTNGAGITAGTFADWTGLSQAVTAGVQYYGVFTNGNASPAANFPAFLYSGGGLPGKYGGNNNYGWSKWQSNGTTWSGGSAGSIGLRVGFSDGTYDGFLISSISSSTDLCFGTNEIGMAFLTPNLGTALNVAGLTFAVKKNGSPTGNVVLKLYAGGPALGATGTGATLLGTTKAVALGNIGASINFYQLYFPAPVAVPPNTVVRVTAADTAADSSSNCFKTPFDLILDADANSLALTPFGGTAKYATKTSDGGTTFVDSAAGTLRPFELLIDTNTPFAVGGSPIVIHQPSTWTYEG